MGVFDNVQDITHYSKRTQAGNLIAAGVIPKEEVTTSAPKTSVPQNITIEGAIQYYRDNATGDYARLYTATADWLERLNSYSRTVVQNALSKESETTDTDYSDTPTVDMSEVNDE